MCRLLALRNFGRLGGTAASPDLGQFLAQSHLGNVVGEGCRCGQEVSQRISTNGGSNSGENSCNSLLFGRISRFHK